MAPWPALRSQGRFLDETIAGVSRLFFFDGARRAKETQSLVLIHGLGDEGDSFRHLFPLLEGDFRLIAPDLPGFGRSVARGKTSFRLCVESVASLLKSEKVEGAIVLGSSLGASIAQMLAYRHPGLVSALILEDGGSPAPNKAASSILAMALPVFGERRYEGFRGDREAAIRSLAPYYGDWEGLSEADKVFLSTRVVDRVNSRGQERAYLSLLRSTMATMLFSSALFAKQLQGWKGHLEVLWGEKDFVVPRESGRAIADRVAGSRFEIVHGAGHLPHQERPEAVAEAVRRAAKKVGR